MTIPGENTSPRVTHTQVRVTGIRLRRTQHKLLIQFYFPSVTKKAPPPGGGRASVTTSWCQLESNQRHKDFQSFALPTELWHRIASAILEPANLTKLLEHKKKNEEIFRLCFYLRFLLQIWHREHFPGIALTYKPDVVGMSYLRKLRSGDIFLIIWYLP